MVLTKNSPAPTFTLPTDTGGTWSLADHRGQWVVVYFYPKDDTPGCTTEGCDFRDSHPNFQKLNVQIIGISKDSVASHKKFKDKHQLTFPLGSDGDGQVCEAYGVWVEKSMYGKKYFGIERSTFLINPEGHIQEIWRDVKVPGHVDSILEILRG